MTKRLKVRLIRVARGVMAAISVTASAGRSVDFNYSSVDSIARY